MTDFLVAATPFLVAATQFLVTATQFFPVIAEFSPEIDEFLPMLRMRSCCYCAIPKTYISQDKCSGNSGKFMLSITNLIAISAHNGAIAVVAIQ
ncbi:hypothetical protein ABDK09_02625 [Vibrio sp. CDRSL-10 TSBA]